MAFQVVFQVYELFSFFFYFFFLVMGLSSGGGGGGEGGSSTVEIDSLNCNFPAIFNFGDSNSDTGGISAAFTAVPPPNGETFFGKPSGRFCDGRLIIDFIAEELGLPYLSPYLDSLGASCGFEHGANFATGGSSVRKGGYSPFHLDVQISQFLQFKARINDLYSTQQPHQQQEDQGQPFLPKPDDFSKALYTLDIGQNDLSYGFQYTTEIETRASIPQILDQFSTAVHQLYKEGARAFWVHNTGPIGCLPYSVIYYPKKSGNLDQNGCVKPRNEIAQEFNSQLKSRLIQFRSQLPNTTFTYVDVYSVKYNLISSAKSQGYVDPLEFCCGSYYGAHFDCGEKEIVNGTVYGGACDNPTAHISWDGIHYTEAANQWVAKYILNGSMSDPQVPIAQACHNTVNP
ncbi:Lipase [Macleaya cordata]|uniref:Lipase n=1 Tax=Macleaya cordata TaxID=56857 RepID=A0A200QHF3_MACCD|nr:Lipase [Macleaya cordata]